LLGPLLHAASRPRAGSKWAYLGVIKHNVGERRTQRFAN
jgi:hypothetical protein